MTGSGQYQSSEKFCRMTGLSAERSFIRSSGAAVQRTTALSPMRSFDLRSRETRLRGELTFAAGASKAPRQYCDAFTACQSTLFMLRPSIP